MYHRILLSWILVFCCSSGGAEDHRLVILIGGIDSDPTEEQLQGTAERNQGNSGMFQLRDDLQKQGLKAEYFNWNGTTGGEIDHSDPPGPKAIAGLIRNRIQEDSRCTVILVGNSWGGQTVLEVCDDLLQHPQPLAIEQAIFIDPSSLGRAKRLRPQELPINLNRALNYFTRNQFGWKSLTSKRAENIDLGDPKNGYMVNGSPNYSSLFDIEAHIDAEWDPKIHRDVIKRLQNSMPDK